MANAVRIDFPHRPAGHCGSGALRDLLEFHGLSYDGAPPREGFAFGLGGGLGFNYFELPGIEPPLYAVGRTAGLERDFCEHLGIELDLRRTDDAEEGWAWLRAELDAGHPTMVNADIKELDYLRVRMNNTMHDVVVTGYDEDEGVAFIADNDRDEIQRCSLESLARARSSQAFPAPNRHATWVMRFPDELPEPRLTIEAALRRAVENMRTAGASLASAPATPGLEHVAAFAASYPEWPERFGDSLGPALRGLRVFIVKAGTGGAMFRSLHAEFLQRCGGAARRCAARRGRQDLRLIGRRLGCARRGGGEQRGAGPGPCGGLGAHRGDCTARVRGRGRDGAGRAGAQVSRTILPSLPPSEKRS